MDEGSALSPFHLAFSSIACACRGLGWSPGDTIDLEQSNKKRRGRYREYIPADWLTSATEPIFTSVLMMSEKDNFRTAIGTEVMTSSRIILYVSCGAGVLKFCNTKDISGFWGQ